MYLLLGGSGVGYSIQQHHIAKLPVKAESISYLRGYSIDDSIEGWADAVKVLMEDFVKGTSTTFDYSLIRPKGAPLKTAGGKAPGPEPLRIALERVQGILDIIPAGKQLTSLQIHDIICHIADSVRAGGIRRSALIALFSKTDYEMLTCKSGAWWESNAQRGRANNSVVLERSTTTKKEFDILWATIRESRAGEPGEYWTDDIEMGTNPCVEIGLRAFQFCNL
jgi:ribonucleoside-triphosphate reductase